MSGKLESSAVPPEMLAGSDFADAKPNPTAFLAATVAE
jgi:hypothetical protein